MKIAIITIGSRGDAQPCVALAIGLQKEGHQVVIGAPPNHQSFIASFGIKFVSVGIDTDDFIQKMFTGKFSDPASEMFRMSNTQNQDAWKLCQEERPDFILAHQGIEALLPIAKKLNIQCAEICFAPWDPTDEFQNYFGPSGNGSEIANYINNIQIHEASWLTKPKYIQSTLETMQVPSLPTTCYWKYKRACHVPILYAFSPSVIRPKEWNEPDYYITGYWPLRQPNWTPSAELVEFVADAPLYIGFGSMYQADPRAFFDTIVKALEETGQKAVVAGYKQFYKEELKSKIFMVENVPHEWLFPRMKAIVTHGGAGTTASALMAGKPTIVVPHFGDQTLWGNYVHKKVGVGPEPIPSAAFTVEKLVAAIREAISSEQMKENAKLVAEKIAKEDGIAKAIEVIKKVRQEDKQWKEEVKWFEDFPWTKASRPMPSTREDFMWLKEHGMFPFTKEEIEANVAN